jgi:hypothetical protein
VLELPRKTTQRTATEGLCGVPPIGAAEWQKKSLVETS